jgi:hypothetical protein
MRELMLLTGTPISRPGDSFAYIKLRSPEIYRNLTHFERLHVGERDFWDNVVRWENLDFLHENLMLNSVRLLKREELGGEDPLYDPIEYELDDEHYRLYKKLASSSCCSPRTAVRSTRLWQPGSTTCCSRSCVTRRTSRATRRCGRRRLICSTS